MKYLLILSTLLMIGCGKSSNVVGVDEEGAVITTLTIDTMSGGCPYSLDVYIDDVPVMSIYNHSSPLTGTVDVNVGEHNLLVVKEISCPMVPQREHRYDITITVTESGFTDTY